MKRTCPPLLISPLAVPGAELALELGAELDLEAIGRNLDSGERAVNLMRERTQEASSWVASFFAAYNVLISLLSQPLCCSSGLSSRAV